MKKGKVNCLAIYCVLTCVITINCKLHFSSFFFFFFVSLFLKFSSFQYAKSRTFPMANALHLHFAFIFVRFASRFTPQPQRLIELVGDGVRVEVRVGDLFENSVCCTGKICKPTLFSIILKGKRFCCSCQPSSSNPNNCQSYRHRYRY